jgi:mono/diheme cytochrome c family protein
MHGSTIRRVGLLVCVALGAGCGGSDGDPLDAYNKASVSRGGKLYDSWAAVVLTTEEIAKLERNPAYEGTSTNVTTSWRCTTCHGWTYGGTSGKDAAGAPFTVAGVLDSAAKSPDALFASLRSHPGADAGFGSRLSDPDVWNLVKFLREGTAEIPATAIDPPTKKALGDVARGKTLYEQGHPGSDPTQSCLFCHGVKGNKINFHDTQATPEYIRENSDDPWQFAHHVRFGKANRPVMPAFDDKGWTMQDVIDVTTYAQSLPTQ